jgi:ferredoxin
MLAPLNHISVWTVKPPTEACISCGKCDRVCPTDVEPSKRISAGIPANRALDCIVCHECREKCALK